MNLRTAPLLMVLLMTPALAAGSTESPGSADPIESGHLAHQDSYGQPQRAVRRYRSHYANTLRLPWQRDAWEATRRTQVLWLAYDGAGLLAAAAFPLVHVIAAAATRKGGYPEGMGGLAAVMAAVYGLPTVGLSSAAAHITLEALAHRMHRHDTLDGYRRYLRRVAIGTGVAAGVLFAAIGPMLYLGAVGMVGAAMVGYVLLACFLPSIYLYARLGRGNSDAPDAAARNPRRFRLSVESGGPTLRW
jgi:hypothetical protein